MPANRASIEKNHKRRDARKNPAIVEIKCCDNLSLFSAVLVGIFQHKNGKGMWKSAGRYARSSSQLSIDAIHFKNEVRETTKLESYDLLDVKKIYEYLEATFPEAYRILVFSQASDSHTVYNSGNNAKHTICLYYNYGHFDLMKTPQKYFRKKHYCVDCEKTYENLKAHSERKIRCRQCFRNGYGYPCTGNLELECQDCHKFFPSTNCMDAHKPYSCNTYHRCVYCNVVYRVRPERPSKGHSCAKAPARASVEVILNTLH
ncbi:hypothetical protein AAVH_40415 [Aphelenchoides avenae]|nr:hypothetical protein AAVH_40415 [Aphelenchus avenae]